VFSFGGVSFPQVSRGSQLTLPSNRSMPENPIFPEAWCWGGADRSRIPELFFFYAVSRYAVGCHRRRVFWPCVCFGLTKVFAGEALGELSVPPFGLLPSWISHPGDFDSKRRRFLNLASLSLS